MITTRPAHSTFLPGAWAVLRLLAAPAARGHPLVAREAVWAIGRLWGGPDVVAWGSEIGNILEHLIIFDRIMNFMEKEPKIEIVERGCEKNTMFIGFCIFSRYCTFLVSWIGVSELQDSSSSCF